MIVIYGIRENLNPIKSKMSAVIHGCLMAELGLPEHKRFFANLIGSLAYPPLMSRSLFTNNLRIAGDSGV